LLRGRTYSLREIFRGMGLRGVDEGKMTLLFLVRDWYEAFS
jgi:hypothetical protein